MNQPNVLDQLAGHWPKLMAILLCKLERAGKIQLGEKVTITPEDIKAMDGYARRNLFTDGRGDKGITFSLVDDAEMSRLAYMAKETNRSFKVRKPGEQ